MAPSGHGPRGNIGGRRVIGGDIPLGILLLQGKCSCRVVQRRMKRAVEQGTPGHSPVSMEDSRDGYHYSRCGGHNDGGSSKEHEFSAPLMEEDDDQGETWFKRESSSAEWRSLLRLERELEAALRFEHGDSKEGESQSNPIWVTCIMLGCLFKERQVLQHAVKLYACFQRREIMCCMVKINDLEEQEEPSLSGTMGASTSATYKGDAMDVEESVGL